MRPLRIGDVSITSLVERDGPWRRPEDFFLGYDTAAQAANVAGLAPEVFDHPSGKMVITYQTFVIRTDKHVILVDTCTGEDKGYAAPIDFDKKPWMDALLAEGLYVNLARPPATPANMTLLRCSLCAEHSDEEVGQILTMFETAGKAVGVI